MYVKYMLTYVVAQISAKKKKQGRIEIPLLWFHRDNKLYYFL